MSDVFFLALRRMRAPIILLVVVYSIATLGMVLIPGQDSNGEPWHMSFFYAFYFVSFMGTTIGFGEIPYEFTDSQRAWVLVCIYTSVVAWLYAIGSVLRLVQDSTFQQALSERSFRRAIERLEQPFYIICGYGETGELIHKGLARLGLIAVVIDLNRERTSSLELEELPHAPITLTGDGSNAQILLKAGINRSNCRGVIAVTENDHVNLRVAVSSKLLNHLVPVLCRSEIEDEAANMASFGTDAIINPYHTFATRLSMMAHKPALHRVQNWLINQHSPEHIADRKLPRGRWIICGYGRLGKAIDQQLMRDGITLVIADPDPIASRAPKDAIIGRGTEATTLHEAGVEGASLIVAASDDDANNLSVLITAKQLNPDIYTIGRVSGTTNQLLFKQAQCDYIMRRSQLVANEVLTIISRPLVTRFIKYSGSLSEIDTEQLITNITQLTPRQNPITWRLCLNKDDAPALFHHLENGRALTVGDVCNHPSLPKAKCRPLLLLRGGVSHLLPTIQTDLRQGDQLLVCGSSKDLLLPQRLANNSELIDTLINKNFHHIPILRWWANRHSPVTSHNPAKNRPADSNQADQSRVNHQVNQSHEA